MNLRNIRLGSTPVTIGLIFGVILTLVLIVFNFIAPFIGQVLGQLTSYVELVGQLAIAYPLKNGFLSSMSAKSTDT